MKKNIKVLEDKTRVIDPWEDYINHNYENLSTFQKILRPIIIFSIATFVLIFIIGFLLVKTGQWWANHRYLNSEYNNFSF